jgi:DNA replication and repair protein RecF
LALVSGEPTIRRRFLNVEISQISPKYCYGLASYKRALEQRNRLLRDMRDGQSSGFDLEAWNEQLILHGAPLFEKRKFFIDRLAPLARGIHCELTEGKEELDVRYIPTIPLVDGEPDTIVESFRSELARVAAEERRRGVTVIGPQRDDIQFTIDGMDARLYASQGQRRTVVLSIKLAQFRLMTEYVGEAPIMLLDDVMSDLDDPRKRQLLAAIRTECQSFITCTSLRDFPEEIVAEADIYPVSGGRITESQPAVGEL